MRSVMEPARQCCRQDEGTPKAVNAIIKWLCHGYAIVDFVFMKFFSHSETFWAFPKNKTKQKQKKWQKCFQTCFSPSVSVPVLMSSQCGYIIVFDLFAHDQIQCTLELSSKELRKGKILKKQWRSSSHCTFVVVLAMLAQVPIRKKSFLLFKPL